MKKRVLKLYPADNEMMTMFTNLQLCKLIIDEPTLVVPDLPIVESSLTIKSSRIIICVDVIHDTNCVYFNDSL